MQKERAGGSRCEPRPQTGSPAQDHGGSAAQADKCADVGQGPPQAGGTQTRSPREEGKTQPQSTDRKPVRKHGKHRAHRQVPEQTEHEARPASSWKIESGSVGTTRTPNAGKTSAYVPAPGGDSCRGVSMEPFRECETALTKASILQNPAFTSPSCAKLQALIFCHTSKNTRKPARLQWVTPLVVQAEAERGCRDTQPRRRPPEGRWIAPGVN